MVIGDPSFQFPFDIVREILFLENIEIRGFRFVGNTLTVGHIGQEILIASIHSPSNLIFGRSRPLYFNIANLAGFVNPVMQRNTD
jgi:hypothetical protein